MNSRKEDISLDDVLDLYQMSSEQSGRDTLTEWIARYPQYEIELQEFAAYRKMISRVPSREYTEEEDKLLTARGVSVVQNLLYQQHQKSHSAKEEQGISSLLDEGKRIHADIDSFVEKTGLSEGIIRMLDRRQTRYETIAVKAVENIACVLGKLVSTIKKYLRGELRVAPSHYKAQQPPEAQQMYDFCEIVSMDDDLTYEQKQYWMSQPPIGPDEDRQEVESK